MLKIYGNYDITSIFTYILTVIFAYANIHYLIIHMIINKYLNKSDTYTRKSRLPATAKLSPGMGTGWDADESMMKV